MSLFYSDQAGFFDSDKRKVRFDQEHFNSDDNESKNKSELGLRAFQFSPDQTERFTGERVGSSPQKFWSHVHCARVL